MHDQLKEQNNGRAWLDCEAHGLAHRLAPEPVPGYWHCNRCPVVIKSDAYPYTSQGGDSDD